MCGFTIARTTDAAASAAAQAGLVQAQLTAISVQPTQFSRGCDSTLSVGLSSPICSDPSQVRAPTLPAAPPRLPLLPPCPLGGRGLSGRCLTPQAAAASYKLIIQGASSGGGDVALTSAPVSSCSRLDFPFAKSSSTQIGWFSLALVDEATGASVPLSSSSQKVQVLEAARVYLAYQRVELPLGSSDFELVAQLDGAAPCPIQTELTFSEPEICQVGCLQGRPGGSGG